MAFFQYLVFDGENLPLPDSYGWIIQTGRGILQIRGIRETLS